MLYGTVSISDLECIGGKITWGEEHKCARKQYESNIKNQIEKNKYKSTLKQREEILSKLEVEADKYSEMEALIHRLEKKDGQDIGEN